MEWALSVDASQAKARLQLPKIEDVVWQGTTFPQLPGTLSHLPAEVTLRVTEDGIQIDAIRRSITWANEVEEEVARIFLPKANIIGIDIILKPEAEEDEDTSRAIIRHRDPYDVVPFFLHMFSSRKPYWMKSLAKAARERLGIEATIADEE